MQVAEGGKEGYNRGEGEEAIFGYVRQRGEGGGRGGESQQHLRGKKRPACPPRMVGWLGGWSSLWQPLVWGEWEGSLLWVEGCVGTRHIVGGLFLFLSLPRVCEGIVDQFPVSHG